MFFRLPLPKNQNKTSQLWKNNININVTSATVTQNMSTSIIMSIITIIMMVGSLRHGLS